MSAEEAKAGMLLSIDTGEYSDHYVIGFFVVLQNFVPRKELDEYLSANPEQAERYHFNNSGFMAHIIKKGLLLEINYANMYLGAYSSKDEFSFTPVQA